MNDELKLNTMRDKSAYAKLYFCTTASCRIITYKNDERCPCCNLAGRFLRGPVGQREGLPLLRPLSS